MDIPDEFADWLLNQYCVSIIDEIKEPSKEGDNLLRAITNLPEIWVNIIQNRIKELPR